jgi:hypothetical protein
MRTKRIIQPGHSLFHLAGPWNGIRPRLTMILRNDAMFRAEHDVNFCDMCSRVLISSAITLNKLAALVVLNDVCISLL